MKSFSRSLLLIAVIILAGCSSRNYLEVETTNFTDQIETLQNLEFTFSRDVAPDSVIGLWDSIPYIEFEPEVKGRFQWADKRKLTFSPSGPFAPNTDYKATLTDLITDLQKEPRRLKQKTVRFHTPYLAMEDLVAYWGINNGNMSLVIKVLFNYPVAPDDVNSYLSLTMGGKDYAFLLLTNSTGTEHELIPEGLPFDPEDLAAKDSKDKDKGNVKGTGKTPDDITITMLPGLKTPGSDRTGKEPQMLTVEVPSAGTLEIANVTTEFEEGQGFITVYTSQPVESQNLHRHIALDSTMTFEATTVDNGFRIKADFGDGKSYRLTLRKTLKGIFGPQLEEEYVQTVTFGSLQPYIAFAEDKGMYLTPGGAGNLGLRIINVPKVKVTVFKIFENNIQHYMRNGQQWEWWEDDEGRYYDSYNYGLSEDYGQVVRVREFNTGALPRKGNLRLLKVTPQDLNIQSDLKGIWLIKAESPDKAWLNDVQLLSFSDLGMIVKEGPDQLFVAVRSIATGLPVPGVTVGLFSRNNQRMHTLKTGGDGVALLNNKKETLTDFVLSMVTASKGDDYNVLLLNRSAVEVSRFEVGGKRTQNLEYDAFIYSDRDLYRPGDSVHMNTILRDFRFHTITGIPVNYLIISPDGKDFLKRRIMVNAQGAAAFSFALPAKALTGNWVTEIQTVNGVVLGNRRLKVEEFMPDRIAVKVSTDKKDYLPGEMLRVEIAADNLSGTPAAGRKVENELRVNRRAFNPKAFKDYNFSLTTREEPYIMSTINTTATGGDGKASQIFELPAFRNTGILEGKVYTTVFDETGRPVNRLSVVNIHTQQIFTGMKNLPGWLSTGKPVPLQLIALNVQEKQVAARALLEVIRVNWETVLERNWGQTSYNSQRKENRVLSRTINIAAGGSTEQFIPQASGEYLVRLRLPGSNAWVEQSFYAYRWGSSDESSFMVSKDGEVEISFDKKLYKPGDEAGILFKTPFEGELLVTVEQDKVLAYYSLKADNNGASMKLKIKDAFMPNVYVTATLLRRTATAGIPLTVAHGFSSVMVEKPDNRLPLTISAPEKIRSSVMQKITIKTKPGAEVTIAAVDEGILQITDYKTPDPYGYFYNKRALEVSAYDLFDELLPELLAKRSSTGGDQAFDLGRRLNPLTAKRVKLLSYWSGRKVAGASGEVTFTVKVPAFNGALRIMAAAYKDQQFGSAEKIMKIADPVSISSSIPRFVSPGDKVNVHVTLSNNTGKPVIVNTSVNATGPCKASQPDKEKVTLPANSETRVIYTLTAGNTMGISTIQFKAATAGETFAESTELPVRPAVPLVKDAQSGIFAANQTTALKSRTEMIPGSGSSRLLLTDNPAGLVAAHIGDLVNYPYGCTEQIISAAFPQLYYTNLAALLQKNSIFSNTDSRGNSATGDQGSKTSAEQNITDVIRRINSLQQYNGGMVMWPGGGEVNWWVTAYAAHFLYEAERAGYSVDRQVLSGLQQYLLEMVKQKGAETYYYKTPGNVQWQHKRFARREIFYSLYVLTLSGKHHLPTMNYYKNKASAELTTDSRYLLASAFAMAGDQKSASLLSPKGTEWEESAVMTGGSFSSPIRDRALALYTMIEADADNPQVAVIARQLGEMIRATRWLSTQEKAFSLLALGRLSENQAGSSVTATIKYDGKSTDYKGDDLLLALKANSATVSTKGNGKLFWYFESEGLPVSMKVQETDQILKVRRQLYTRNGQPISGREIRLSANDPVVVGVTISTTDNSMVENVVITDLLPAGLEIENARLTAEREMEWIKDRGQPDYLDIRDDRVNFFASASGKPVTFYYTARAVSYGTFVYGPVGAEAMYNGQYFSYYGQGKVTVE